MIVKLQLEQYGSDCTDLEFIKPYLSEVREERVLFLQLLKEFLA